MNLRLFAQILELDRLPSRLIATARLDCQSQCASALNINRNKTNSSIFLFESPLRDAFNALEQTAQCADFRTLSVRQRQSWQFRFALGAPPNMHD